jgi:ferredoxin-NADP reductase
MEDGKACIRHYSISSSNTNRDSYEIAVLRDNHGAGGSTFVHQSYNIGLQLHCKSPGNNFPLHGDQRPAVLIAGGIGITPIKAMAHALKQRGAELHLHYAARSDSEMAFRNQLVRELGADMTVYRSDNNEHLDIGDILARAAPDALFYVCGPAGLIDALIVSARDAGIDPERVRFERFGATIEADARPIKVELSRSKKTVEVGTDQTILDAMLESGIDAPFSCRAGNCRSCAVKVLDGEPDHRDTALSPADREEYGLMCPCVSRAKTGHLVLDI